MAKMYHIMKVCGLQSDDLSILVHIVNSSAPDDWESYKGAIVRKQKDSISVEVKIEEWVQLMWQTPSGAIYVPSVEGHMYSKLDGHWEKTSIPGEPTLNGVWGYGNDVVYCCGLHGVVLEKRKNSWIHQDIELDEPLQVIGGVGADDLYALGYRGKMFHFNGRDWTRLESPTNYQLVAILCRSHDEVYIVGRKGTAFRGALNAWEVLEGGESNFYSLAHYNEKIFIGAGLNGVLNVEGNRIVPFNEGVLAKGMQVVGDKLFAYGKNILEEFDGVRWSRREFDFEELLESPGK